VSDAEIRAWLREQGEDVGARGTLPRAQRDRYDAAHPGPDYDPGMSDADFDVSAADAPPPDDETEAKPRAVATPKPASKLAGWGRGRAKAAGKTAKGKPRHPRVPVDDLIAGVWRGLAGFARPLPATSRLLKIQAPIAGVLLEDTVKGTVVDRWMQPLARTSKNAEAIAVLVGPPVLVGAIEMQRFRALAAGEDPNQVPAMGLLLPPLRELLLRMCKVGGPKMAAAMAREREFETEFGQTVDDMLMFLFDIDGGAGAGEDDAVRRAQEAMQAAAA